MFLFFAFLSLIYIFLFSILGGNFNGGYLILSFFNILILVNCCTFLYFVVISAEKSLEKMEKDFSNNNLLRNKLLFALIEQLKVILISATIFLIIKVSGVARLIEENNIDKYIGFPNPFHLSLNYIEIILVVLITIAYIFITIFAPYWFVKHFVRIKHYDHKIKQYKIRLGRFSGGYLLLLTFILFLQVIDMLFIGLKMGDPFNNWFNLSNLIQDQYLYVILLGKLILLLLFLADLFLDRVFKKRNIIVFAEIKD